MPEFIGKVTKKPFARGSKSERQAVILETGGRRFVLRRPDGNPLRDPELDKLVGKTIRARGEIEDYELLLDDWAEVPD